MCGIAGIILKKSNNIPVAERLLDLSRLLKHRGPDGEGFILARRDHCVPYYHTFHPQDFADVPYQPKEKLPVPVNTDGLQLAFVHRRLSIIELSEKGRQPMCDPDSRFWITYNGELYNYVELREELHALGCHFVSESDTEVILQAYKYWGTACVERFNGMWSFCLYDIQNKLCFASRDRLGVKPFYYTTSEVHFAFASEQKALVKSGLCRPGVHAEALQQYLVNSRLEYASQNFFEHIQELPPGHNLVYHLQDHRFEVCRYFALKAEEDPEIEQLSEKLLIERIREVLLRAIRLRLRSDVEVGTCLSGGIDSSAIAGAIAHMTRRPLHCFTAVFPGSKVNEESFADLAAKKAGGIQHKISPEPEGFLRELDELIYAQDVPIWDTSTYAQHLVMKLASQNGIKVVLDGQGADELFAGYHHHFLAQWRQYFLNGQFLEGLKAMQQSAVSINHPFNFYLKETLKKTYHPGRSQLAELFTADFFRSTVYRSVNQVFPTLNEQLIHDTGEARLKSFLKCEDRCGMWHSVESRVPFSDDPELIRLMFSFNGNRKIRNGRSKYLLREALKDLLPAAIYERTDKKGFDTPSEEWLQKLLPQMLSEIRENKLEAIVKLQALQAKHFSLPQLKTLFRLFVFCRWKKLFMS